MFSSDQQLQKLAKSPPTVARPLALSSYLTYESLMKTTTRMTS